jgi:hypothetical protein
MRRAARPSTSLRVPSSLHLARVASASPSNRSSQRTSTPSSHRGTSGISPSKGIAPTSPNRRPAEHASSSANLRAPKGVSGAPGTTKSISNLEMLDDVTKKRPTDLTSGQRQPARSASYHRGPSSTSSTGSTAARSPQRGRSKSPTRSTPIVSSPSKAHPAPPPSALLGAEKVDWQKDDAIPDAIKEQLADLTPGQRQSLTAYLNEVDRVADESRSSTLSAASQLRDWATTQRERATDVSAASTAMPLPTQSRGRGHHAEVDVVLAMEPEAAGQGSPLPAKESSFSPAIDLCSHIAENMVAGCGSAMHECQSGIEQTMAMGMHSVGRCVSPIITALQQCHQDGMQTMTTSKLACERCIAQASSAAEGSRQSMSCGVQSLSNGVHTAGRRMSAVLSVGMGTDHGNITRPAPPPLQIPASKPTKVDRLAASRLKEANAAHVERSSRMSRRNNMSERRHVERKRAFLNASSPSASRRGTSQTQSLSPSRKAIVSPSRSQSEVPQSLVVSPPLGPEVSRVYLAVVRSSRILSSA